MNKLLRTVEKQPIQQISIEVHDFSLGKAMPQDPAAIGEQIDRDEASDDFMKEELHAKTVHQVQGHIAVNRQAYGSHCVDITWLGAAGLGLVQLRE